MQELWFRGQLQEIGRDECFELLESTSVGRIGYCTTGGAVVLPVNHAVIGGDIVVRLNPSGQTARYLRDNAPDADVTFEVDHIDEHTQSGWSVLVSGTTLSIDAESLADMTDRPIPWPAGGFWDYVRIRPRRVTGRRLAPS